MSDLGPAFHLIEIQARQPGELRPREDRGYGAAPYGALARRVTRRESTIEMRASDSGYRSRPADPQGVVTYPPLLDSAFSVTREMGLAPSQALQTFGWGSAVPINADRRWDGAAAAYDANGRRVRVLTGRRSWDEARGLWVDPPFSGLREVFGGIAGVWSPTEDSLTVPLRDVSYWIEGALQTRRYAGTGGYEGTAALTGRPRPMVRGGTTAAPVRQVTPVLIDPVNLIYDAGGRVVTLYEAGDMTRIPAAGDVPDLYGGSTSPGQYRTARDRGAFRLGSKPVGTITVDVIGGGPATAGRIALGLMLDDMQVPADHFDVGSFLDMDDACPWPCGWARGEEEMTGAQAVAMVLASVGARLVTTRQGNLRAVPLATIPAGAVAEARYTAGEIVSLVPLGLGEPLSPAPGFWQVGYARNHTVQTSNLDPDLTAAEADALGQEWRQAGAVSNEVLAASRRPSRPAMVPTAHLTEAGALALATQLRDLWCVPRPRRLMRMTLPAELATQHELGAVLAVTYPSEGFDGGALCQVVGDAFRAGAETGTITILA